MIIGIMGFAGTGKGTVGDLLIEEGFYKFSFADTLKDVVSTLFLWPRELLEGDTEPSRIFREKEDPWWTERFGYSVTPRLILQKMGTEAGRDVFHPEIWIHTLERRSRGYPNVVVPDVRFPNECKFIKDKGGFLIRVGRDEIPKHEYGFHQYCDEYGLNRYEVSNEDLKSLMETNFPKVHASEWSWLNQKPDVIIDNNGTVEELRVKVKQCLLSLEKSSII